MQVTDEMVRVACAAYRDNAKDGTTPNLIDMRAALTATLAAMWRPIEEAPKNERILVYNELWDETHGAHQIAMLDFAGNWQFDSELCIDDITEDDIEASEDEPLTPEDFKPQKWARLPSPPKTEG